MSLLATTSLFSSCPRTRGTHRPTPSQLHLIVLLDFAAQGPVILLTSLLALYTAHPSRRPSLDLEIPNLHSLCGCPLLMSQRSSLPLSPHPEFHWDATPWSFAPVRTPGLPAGSISSSFLSSFCVLKHNPGGPVRPSETAPSPVPIRGTHHLSGPPGPAKSVPHS